MRNTIEALFNKEINKVFSSKPDIEKFLVNHERKNLAIDNILGEIRVCELRVPQLMHTKTFNEIISSSARIFCKLALEDAEVRSMTSLQRSMAEKEAQAMQEEFDSLDDGVMMETL